MVESKYGSEPANTFRSLQRNTSVFPPNVIDKVETAIGLCNLQPRQRGTVFNRGRGWRGRWNAGHRGRGGYISDPYGQYRNASIPDQYHENPSS